MRRRWARAALGVVIVLFGSVALVPVPVRPAAAEHAGGFSVSLVPGNGSGVDPAALVRAAPPAASVEVACALLALSGCGTGDDVDALSSGAETGAPAPVVFSPAHGAAGSAGSAVAGEAACSPSEAAADLFTSAGDTTNAQFADGDGKPCGQQQPADGGVGLCELAPCPAGGDATDDLDALELQPPEVAAAGALYLSLADGSPSLAAVGATAADVLRYHPAADALAVWAPAAALGLQAGDELDALCLADDGDGVFGADADLLFFSLGAGSPSLAQAGLGPGDVLRPGPALAVAAPQLGLSAGDELDALACNAPEVFLRFVQRDGRRERAISVSPPAVDFGRVAVGETVTSTVAVQNAGTAGLVIGAVVAPSAPFGLADDTCSHGLLAPGGSCRLGVRFATTPWWSWRSAT